MASVQLELGLRFLQQVQAVVFQKAVGAKGEPPKAPRSESPLGDSWDLPPRWETQSTPTSLTKGMGKEWRDEDGHWSLT